MALRRGIFERLVGFTRGTAPPPNRSESQVPPAPPAPSAPAQTTAEALIAAHMAEATAAMRAGQFPAWLTRPEPFPRGLPPTADPALQIACLRFAMDRLANVRRRAAGSPRAADAGRNGRNGNTGFSNDEAEAYLLWLVVSHIVYRNLPYTDDDVVYLLDRMGVIVDALPVRGSQPPSGFEFLSLRELLTGIVQRAGAHGVGAETRAAAERLRDAVTGTAAGDRLPVEERSKLFALLLDVLDGGGPEGLLNDRDEWGGLVRETLKRMEPAERAAWRPVFEHASKANGARPTDTWLKRAGQLVAAVGEDAFAREAVTWLGFYSAPPRRAGGENAAPPEMSGMAERNVTVLRGLIWFCAGRDDAGIARAVGDAIEASFKKIPGVGPRSLKLGNAGLYALGAMPGMPAAEQLVRLRQRVIYPQARKAIDAALDAAAARRELAREDLDDLATPTFGLVDGRCRFAFDPFAAELTIAGTAGVEIAWFGPDGAARRTEPAEVKQRYPEERAALKRTADDLRKALLAQRERLERLLITERSWPLPVWRERYLDHPLLAELSRRLIWTFEHDGREDAGAWRDGAIFDVANRPLDSMPAETRVRLWHPVRADRESVAAWQGWLERHEVRQPFKQAHREIYVLTDAERTTETYSNRFAGHILRQHQFRALAQARGWRYRLQGGFDDWSVPTLELPDWGLAVEFMVETIDVEDALTNAGVSLFVATDQVRFRRANNPRRDYYDRYGDVVPLAEIPPLVLTEVMRDVDLFVGVASVGADATWRDRGPQRIREYWNHYTFGDLTASAQMRRTVLERLVPRLAIAERCALEDRFLVVRGELRTYRIHLGSGNIMMEPNNQYLCIVPQRGGPDAGSDLFLPFEGDSLLSTILSKAILLADDRAITDPTITRQIGRLAA